MLDSSGRVLVGTSTARGVGSFYSFPIQNENTSAAGITFVTNSNDAESSYLVLGKSRGTSTGSNTIVQANDVIGRIAFAGADGTDLETRAATIEAQVDGTPGTNDMPGRLVFSTTADGAASPTERMRIGNTGQCDHYGNTGVLNVRSGTAAGTGTAYLEGYHTATTTSNGTRSFLVFTNGNVQNTNGSYTTISDIKLKENIVDAGSQWDDLKAIQIRNWNFKAETGHETHRQIGPIAQELETVCPGLVFETPDCDADGNETDEVTKSVNQSVLYMKAVKALQEAMERIEQLEAKVAALETK